MPFLLLINNMMDSINNHHTIISSWLPHTSSVESQKGAINIQRCSVENHKGSILLYNVYIDSALLVLNGNLQMNIDSALLALNWQHIDSLLKRRIESRSTVQYR